MANLYAGLCRVCGGSGTRQEYSKRESRYIHLGCYECDGGGLCLHEEGRELLEFLESIGVVVPNPDGWREK